MRLDAVTGGADGRLEAASEKNAAFELDGGGNGAHKAIAQLRIGRRRLAPEPVEGTLSNVRAAEIGMVIVLLNLSTRTVGNVLPYRNWFD